MKIGASEYHYISSISVEVIARRDKEDSGRRFTIHIDEPCIIQPVIPENHRNRGRKCIVRYLKNGKATVEFFEGTGHRLVRVPLCDVVPQTLHHDQTSSEIARLGSTDNPQDA